MLILKTLRSSTFRLALLYVGALGLLLAALFAYVSWSTTQFLRDRYDHVTMTEMNLLIDTYGREGDAGVERMIAAEAAAALVARDVLLLAKPDYTPLAGTLEQWPAGVRGRDGWVEFPVPGEAQTRPLVRAYVVTLTDGDRLLVGRRVEDWRTSVQAMSTGIALAVGLLCVFAIAAGISVTRRTVTRIEAINTTSRAIMARGLGERIPMRGTRDEWDQLAGNLNSMLARIEELVRGIKLVSDNVAHDLRTPLMRLRGRLERALNDRSRAPEDEVLLARAVSELDDVLKTFAALLRISSVEARERTVGFAAVDLAALAAEVADLFDAAAEERGGHVRCLVGPAAVQGDRDLLFEAVANLVDNALKHGTGDARIAVETLAGGAVKLTVADRGPGIPEAERMRVFERFYRLERSRTTPGNGLGLSLVHAVAQLHGARVAFEDVEQGLCIAIIFPALGAAGAPGAAQQSEREGAVPVLRAAAKPAPA